MLLHEPPSASDTTAADSHPRLATCCTPPWRLNQEPAWYAGTQCRMIAHLPGHTPALPKMFDRRTFIWSCADRDTAPHWSHSQHQQTRRQNSRSVCHGKDPRSGACDATTSARCSTSRCARLSRTATGCTATPASTSSGCRPSRQGGGQLLPTTLLWTSLSFLQHILRLPLTTLLDSRLAHTLCGALLKGAALLLCFPDFRSMSMLPSSTLALHACCAG